VLGCDGGVLLTAGRRVITPDRRGVWPGLVNGDLHYGRFQGGQARQDAW